jgi:hypothetical protein
MFTSNIFIRLMDFGMVENGASNVKIGIQNS